MLLRFSLDDIEEELAQLLIARPSPQRLHDVELEITSEAGSQFPVTGETEFVTALAEMQVSHRPDEADALGAAWDLIIAGRAIRAELGLREQRAKLPFDRASRFGDREEVGLGQDLGRADRHQLNEPEQKIAFRREVDQCGEPFVIASAHQDAVDLYLGKTGRDGRVDARNRFG